MPVLPSSVRRLAVWPGCKRIREGGIRGGWATVGKLWQTLKFLVVPVTFLSARGVGAASTHAVTGEAQTEPIRQDQVAAIQRAWAGGRRAGQQD